MCAAHVRPRRAYVQGETGTRKFLEGATHMITLHWRGNVCDEHKGRQRGSSGIAGEPGQVMPTF